MKPTGLTALLSFLLLLGSCSPQSSVDERLKESLGPLKEKYAPDARVAVFTVVPERQGSVLVAKGEVDNPRAKDEALEVLTAESQGTVLDSILVLPDPALGKKTFGIVNVSVGNLRTKAGHPQELATQVQMGMVVRILKEHRGWWYVQSNDSYLGWIEKGSLKGTDEEGMERWVDAPKVIVTDYFGIVRVQPNAKSMPVTDVVAGVVMRMGPRTGSWQTVYLPDDKKGYIERSLVEEYSSWKHTRNLSAENITETAKSFMGIPYLWGGTSVKGFDCSGFTKIVFRLNGMELNRDANQQAAMGEEVRIGKDLRELKKGDLLFFGRAAREDRPERIWHVAIYLGDKEFVHCAGKVRINSLDENAPHYDEERARTFVRARRLIGTSLVREVG